MEEKEEIRAAILGLFTTSNVTMFWEGCFSDQWPLRLENKVIARLAAAEARKRRRLRVENAAEMIHGFMRSARARKERERITRRAAAKARKRAKVAARRERMHFGSDLDGSTEAEAISGGDAITVDERMQSGDEDDSSVPVIGRDAATSIQGVELSLGGAIDGLAIYGAGVYAGHKCESYASDGTFCEANVGGDNDEKYEDDDFSVSEVLPAPCDSDRIVGMCFQNVNVWDLR